MGVEFVADLLGSCEKYRISFFILLIIYTVFRIFLIALVALILHRFYFLLIGRCGLYITPVFLGY